MYIYDTLQVKLYQNEAFFGQISILKVELNQMHIL